MANLFYSLTPWQQLLFAMVGIALASALIPGDW